MLEKEGDREENRKKKSSIFCFYCESLLVFYYAININFTSIDPTYLYTQNFKDFLISYVVNTMIILFLIPINV